MIAQPMSLSAAGNPPSIYPLLPGLLAWPFQTLEHASTICKLFTSSARADYRIAYNEYRSRRNPKGKGRVHAYG